MKFQGSEADAIGADMSGADRGFTLKGAEHPYRVMVETMSEGALAVAPDGAILYCNGRFAEMAKASREAIIGSSLPSHFAAANRGLVSSALHQNLGTGPRLRANLLAGDGTSVPVQLALRLADAAPPSIAVVVTDLTGVATAEAALRRSEKRYRTLVTATSQVVWTTDGKGRIVEDSPRWRSATGLSAQDIFGNHWVDAIHPDDRDALRTVWSRALREHSPFETEYRLRRRDGAYRHMSVHGVPVKDEDGAIREWIGTGTDITERKETAQKLEASEALFRGLVEQQIAGIYIIETDGTIAYVNPRFAEIIGYTADEVIGRSIFDFVASPNPAIVREKFAALLSEAQSSSEIAGMIEAKDGRIVDVITHGTVATYRGRPVAIGVILDITQRRGAERDLQASEERFRLLVEAAPDAVLLYDADENRFLAANQAAERLFACSRDEIVRRGPLDFYPAEQPDGRPPPETFSEHLAKALAGEETVFDRRIVNAAGEERLCRLTLIRLPSKTSRLLRASHVDVTEQRRAEEALAAQMAILATEHELSPDGILVVDKSDQAVSTNRRFAEILEIPTDLIATRQAAAARALIADRTPDSARFLDRVHYLYKHHDENGHDEIALKNGRVIVRDTAPMRINGEYFGRVWFFRDVTERVEAARSLQRLNRALRTLSGGNEALIRASDEAELLREMCRVIVEAGYRMAWVGAAKHDAAKSVVPVAWAGEVEDYLEKIRISWDDSPRGRGATGRAIRTGQPQIARNIAGDPSMRPWRTAAARLGFASSITLPLKHDKPFAALIIYAGEPDAFTDEEQRLLQELADDLSYGVRALRQREKAETLETRWRASLEAAVAALANTVEMRDPYTAGHQQRVAALAVAIACELGLADAEVHGINLAATLHDVGKITVPAEILNKPGRLSELEYKLIQAHSQAGYDIVKGIDFPWPIAQMILQHHERLDGSGYPRGLKNGAILREAQILGVADVVEAMVSHRPYRPGRGLKAALTEIERAKGGLFDPAVVDACIALFREQRFAFAGAAN